MKFTKMHGIGNDYVYVNCFEERVEDPAALSIRVSDRHFGIGSDGLILIKPSDVADFRMEIYNADGSQAQMCGNGIRCVAKYVYDYGLTDQTTITVDTLAGVKTLELKVIDGKVETVRVDMGEPILVPGDIPVLAKSNPVVAEPIMVDGKEYQMTCVSMGNPHAVYFTDDVEGLDLEKIGPSFENHERFPERINSEFVQILDQATVRMRVWERGSGITMACGTGACATAVACILNHLTERTVTVKLDGGELTINWNKDDGHVYMTGPAAVAFDGEIRL